MIHIAVGTKAQLIKMTPLIISLRNRKVPFRLIDLGQHSLITRDLREEFNLDDPDVYLSRGENVSTLWQGMKWLIRSFAKSLSASGVRKSVFGGQGGVCLIHGDTVSTILGLYLAKRAGIPVAHIEAGLRSYSWFDPFPEEIIRLIAMRFSDILFAPSQWAYNNLIKMGYGKKIVLVPGNTGYETVLASLAKPVTLDLPSQDFCLVTFHRFENIYSRKRLVFIIELLEEISKEITVVFVQHEPTRHQLIKYGLLDRLERIRNKYYCKILSHAHFIHVLDKSRFVLTDGGSIQEESFYLNKPCLLLREKTERNEGLGENVVLSCFDRKTAQNFIRNYGDFRREKTELPQKNMPSDVIVGHLEPFISKNNF